MRAHPYRHRWFSPLTAALAYLSLFTSVDAFQSPPEPSATFASPMPTARAPRCTNQGGGFLVRERPVRAKREHRIRALRSSGRTKIYSPEENDDASSLPTAPSRRRRGVLVAALRAVFVPIALSASPPAARAAADASTAPKDAALRLRRVPVFAIVSSTGKPFMILSRAATTTGYFFTSYEGAKLVLDNSRKEAASDGRTGLVVDPAMWEDARITAVPLDFVMKLSVKRPQSMAQNGKMFDTVYDVLPSGEDVEDAVRIDKSGLFGERGRVPLFYIEGMGLPQHMVAGGGTTVANEEKKQPVYFHKADLLRDWDRQNPGIDPPQLKVLELIDTFQAMINPTADKGFLDTLVFVPPPENNKAAAECEKARGGVGSPYQLGEMIAVGGG